MARQQQNEPDRELPRTHPGVDHLTGRDGSGSKKTGYLEASPTHSAHDNDAQKLGMGHATDKNVPGQNPLTTLSQYEKTALTGSNVADHPAMKRGQAQRSDAPGLEKQVLDNAELKHNSNMP